MKRVNMRTFLRDINDIEPPITVTSWGKPVFVVIPWEDWNSVISHPSDVGREVDRPIGSVNEGVTL